MRPKNLRNGKMTKKHSGGHWRDCFYLTISIICFFLLSVSIFLMYFNRNDWNYTNKTAGILFWAALIGGGLAQFILWLSYKKWMRKNKIRRKKKRKAGVRCFFSDRNAAIADIIMFAMIIAVVIVFLTAGEFERYIVLSLFIFSFCMHCILNGKLYYHALNQDNILNRLWEKRRDSENERIEK